MFGSLTPLTRISAILQSLHNQTTPYSSSASQETFANLMSLASVFLLPIRIFLLSPAGFTQHPTIFSEILVQLLLSPADTLRLLLGATLVESTTGDRKNTTSEDDNRDERQRTRRGFGGIHRLFFR